MKIHTTTQIEYDDGSLSVPITQTHVFQIPPGFVARLKTPTGGIFSTDDEVVILAGTEFCVEAILDDHPHSTYKMDELEWCHEIGTHDLGAHLVEFIRNENGRVHYLARTASGSGQVTFRLKDERGALTNKQTFRISLIGR